MGETKENTLVNTPYDDVFRTLLNDCSSLIIPVINEVFHENYKGDEKIVFYVNEHFINQQDGAGGKKITDTHFEILGIAGKAYHLECQSSKDESMLVRMFEYDTQIALDKGEIKGDVLTVKFPDSAILFLRSDATTADKMQIRIEIAEDVIFHDIPVMKVKDYSLDEIFEKKLLFLIPFYIFTHEDQFKKYDEDEEKLKSLIEEYEVIRNRLEELCENGVIDEYTKCVIVDMSNKVLMHIAKKYESVKEGVKAVMGGQVLDHEAKRIRNEGIEEGRREGRTEGIETGKEMTNIAHARKMLLGNMEVSIIMDITELSKEKIEGLKQEMIETGQLKEEKKND